MKVKPCTSPSKRHQWDWRRNRYVTQSFLGGARISLRGVYKCRTCGAVKYGPDRIEDTVERNPASPPFGDQPTGTVDLGRDV